MILKVKGGVFAIIDQHYELSFGTGSKGLIGSALRVTILRKELLDNLCLQGLQINAIKDIIRNVTESVHEDEFEVGFGEEKSTTKVSDMSTVGS